MLPELTPAVGRAVEAAQELAGRCARLAVEPTDLLHALLLEDEGRAAVLLTAAGLDWALYQRSRPDLQATPPTGPLPLTVAARDVLRLARDLAPDLTGDFTVASEALLVALLRSQESLLAGLEEQGLELDRLEAALDADRPPPLVLDEPLQLSDPGERTDLGRILDACANRAREGLRVVEDYCRFVLDDPFLVGELKQLRHDLSAVLADLVTPELLAARDTEKDVGTRLSTESEGRREGPADVARASFKRLQEALRSLEEYGKVPQDGGGPEVGSKLEQLRYRSYTLERAALLSAPTHARLAGVRLYLLVAAGACRRSFEWTVREALAGGVGLVQLREKGLTDRELLDRARMVRKWTREAEALFLVNDRPDIARLADADGVHLGQEDLGVRDARRVVGPDALVGVSTHDLDQLRCAILEGASYVGVGPAFVSRTKEFTHTPGLDYVRSALAATTLPAFVIGGVNLHTIGQAVAAGARRVAVSNSLVQCEDPRAVARDLLLALPEL